MLLSRVQCGGLCGAHRGRGACVDVEQRVLALDDVAGLRDRLGRALLVASQHPEPDVGAAERGDGLRHLVLEQVRDRRA